MAPLAPPSPALADRVDAAEAALRNVALARPTRSRCWRPASRSLSEAIGPRTPTRSSPRAAVGEGAVRRPVRPVRVVADRRVARAGRGGAQGRDWPALASGRPVAVAGRAVGRRPARRASVPHALPVDVRRCRARRLPPLAPLRRRGRRAEPAAAGRLARPVQHALGLDRGRGPLPADRRRPRRRPVHRRHDARRAPRLRVRHAPGRGGHRARPRRAPRRRRRLGRRSSIADDRAAFEAHDARLRGGDPSPRRGPARARRGETVWVRERATPSVDAAGRAVAGGTALRHHGAEGGRGRARPRAPHRRARRADADGVPAHDEPRAPDAARRHPRLRRAARGRGPRPRARRPR